MLDGHALTLISLIKRFPIRISITLLMTLGETVLMALILLFVGFAIDGLLAQSFDELWALAGVMAALVGLAVLRRVYDTRVYSLIRMEVGRAQDKRSQNQPVSILNARMAMGRELVQFLEEILPMVTAAIVQLIVTVVILFAFSPTLALAAAIAGGLSLLTYTLFHRRFYRLNRALNQQAEKQVGILDQRKPRPVLSHLMRLRRLEVRISDTEALLYGLIVAVLLALVIFNLWHAATALETTTGSIFSIISYSWEFVESALALPITLQQWTRLSEIMKRINQPDEPSENFDRA
jgi:hypothetical protein